MGLFPPPHGRECHAPLVCAGVLADEEGQVFRGGEREGLAERGLQAVERGARMVVEVVAAEPVFGRGVVLKPRAGGGEEELATGFYEARELVQETRGGEEAVDEIGAEHDVERAEIAAE